jgi:TRPM family ion channel
MLAAHSIRLRGGRSAIAVLAAADVSGKAAATALALPHPRGVVVLNGGTTELPADLIAALRDTLGNGIARVAVEERLTVVTGGTDAGIFSLFGQALDNERTAPCIGVAPAARVSWPGRASPTNRGLPDEELVALEPHHSHFLLVTGDEWGAETEAMLSLADALSADCASLAVLAGGGAGARREILGHVRAGRRVIVLAGTGRFADELAGVVAGGPASDPATAEIASTDLITVVDSAEPSSTLAQLVRARLGTRDENTP